MKKSILILAALLSVFTLSAQRNNSVNTQDTLSEHVTLHASTTFGQDYFCNNFFINTFGADYSKQLNSQTTLYLGANVFNINTSKELKDFAPRNKNAGAMYMGVSYQANKNLTVAGDVFYNGIYNMVGADLDLKYNFSENSFFEISFSFARQLSTSGYNQSVPYWYNEAFHPFILGY